MTMRIVIAAAFVFAGCLTAHAQAQPTPPRALPTPAQLRATVLYFGSETSATMTNDRWLAYDKLAHFSVSFLWTLSSQYVLVSKTGLSEGTALPLSITSSAALGAAKELYDWHHQDRHNPSLRDLAADAAGILVAAGVIWL